MKEKVDLVWSVALYYQLMSDFDDFEERLELTRWEATFSKKPFDLLTIHSLIIDNHPKFKEVKQLIANFNAQQRPHRIRYQQPFIEQLFKMLSQLTRLETAEEQLQYLDKVHLWATKGNNSQKEQSTATGGKSRPTTASTRTRPTTAHSRPGTAKLTIPTKKESIQMRKNDKKVDYDKLKEGQHQFYSGARTLHPQIQHPKKRLREYQRVKLIEDDVESDLEIIQIQEKPVLKEIQIAEEKLIEDFDEEGEEGQEGADGDANIDDIPIEGEEDPAAGEAGQPEEEEKIVVDKLRPKRKVYGQPEGAKISKTRYQGGQNHLEEGRQYKQRKIEEDTDVAQFQAQWAQHRGRAKTDMKRRAESAKILSKMVGIPVKKNIQTVAQENVINFQNIQPAEVASKGSRPVSAFTSDRIRVREQLIKNSFLTGKLSGHIGAFGADTSKRQPGILTAIGAKPKKKTFEQILREAEQKVVRQSQQQVLGVKQSLVKGKVSLAVGKIAKSISHHQRQLPEQWCGVVTGMGMAKNPFIKIAKKKKKKKKKGK